MSGGLLGIARSALISHQTAMQTVSQNIANAETPGYSRQEALLTANVPVSFTYGNVGTGVQVATIIRKRDMLLDDTYRTANGGAGEAQSRRDSLSAIEDIFGEPTDAGMSAALDEFWSSWSDLSTMPSSQAARAVVQQRGRQVSQLFNSYDAGLTQQRTSTLDRLTNSVAQTNQLAQQVADLNGRIVAAENAAQGGAAGDLRDQRDLILDQLSLITGGRVVEQANGSSTFLVGNSTLVDGSSVRPLTLKLDPPVPAPATPLADIPVKIVLGNSVDRLYPLGGQLEAMVNTLNTTIPTVRGRLDAMASAIVTAVNTAHTAGYTFSGTTLPGTAAGNFFDPGNVNNPVSAATIHLASAIDANANLIAASGDPLAPLDNTAATAMVALRSNTTSVSYTHNSVTETGSFLSFFRNTVTRVGLEVKAADDDTAVQNTLADQADIRRQSVSGVNTDEELVNMMRVQQAYTAATKLVKAADEMLQTILAMI